MKREKLYPLRIPKAGARVLLCGDHPWTGEVGEFIEYRETPYGYKPLIRLDNGYEVFVMVSNQWRIIENE